MGWKRRDKIIISTRNFKNPKSKFVDWLLKTIVKTYASNTHEFKIHARKKFITFKTNKS